MDVQVRVPVGIGDLLVVNLAEPVVGGDGTGVGEDQAAYGVGHRGVFLYPPVGDLQVSVHQALVVQNGGAHVPQLLPIFPVENVGLGHLGVARPLEDRFHTVLNGFHTDQVVLDFSGKVRRDL